jgi:hypothetical protein
VIKMKRLTTLVLASAIAAGTLACSDDTDDQGPEPERFTATLNAAGEPPVGGAPVVSPAVGTATIEFLPAGLSYEVTVTGQLTNTVNNAHIHGPCVAPACINGTGSAGVVLNLNPNIGVRTGVVAQGVFLGAGTSLATVTMDSLKAMIRNGNAYVNVHTTGVYSGGEIRAQLVKSN